MNIGEDKAQTQAFIDTWKWDDHAIQGYREIIMNHEGKFTSQIIELIKGFNNGFDHFGRHPERYGFCKSIGNQEG